MKVFFFKTHLVVLQIYPVVSVFISTFYVDFVTIRKIRSRRSLLRLLLNTALEYATCNARENYEGSELNGTYQIRHHQHKHQRLDPLIRSVFKVTTALSNVSSVFQLFSFLVICSSMISKGFGFVAFFASVETSSVCIHLSCLVCL